MSRRSRVGTTTDTSKSAATDEGYPRLLSFWSLAKDVLRPFVARVCEWRARLSARPLAVVLVYHGTSRAVPAPHQAVVPVLPAPALDRHLRHLRERYRVVAASDVIAAAARRRRGERLPVAITFDDDLPSHVEVAAPVLIAHGVPATFFLTGTGLDGGAFWWQILQAAVDRRADLEPLAAEFSLPPRPLPSLTRAIEALAPHERRRLAVRLAELVGDDHERALPADGIADLAARGFTIGFHTRGHDRLTQLTDDALEAALREGREELEAAAGVRIATIAYPHGDADERVASAAADAGFELGFVTAMAPVTPSDPSFLLARPEILAPSASRFALDLARIYARARTVSSSS